MNKIILIGLFTVLTGCTLGITREGHTNDPGISSYCLPDAPAHDNQKCQEWKQKENINP